jgi:DNA-binding PadR family transcriptional regulator
MALKKNKPLTPAVLHILLALAARERHGYGIMKQVEADSHGKVNMGPGTLYGSLGRMLDPGLIRESDRKVDPDRDDERRVYYTITAAGRKALATALAQALVPVIALMMWRPPLSSTEESSQMALIVGVIVLFIMLFVASGLLFRRAGAADPQRG